MDSLEKKIRGLILYNNIFYLFILIHKFYSDDNVPQVIFYMALAFSSVVMEEIFRNRINEFKLYTIIDFTIRVMVLILHFIMVISGMNIKAYCVIISIFWAINNIIELIILKSNNIKEIYIDNIKKEEIDKFIVDINSKKFDYLLIGINLTEEIKKIAKVITASGKRTILIIVLLMLVFISRFIYDNFTHFIFIPILIIIYLLYRISKLSYIINKVIYDNYNSKKSGVDNLTFIIGYIILFIYSVFLYNNLGYFNISTLVLGVLFWIPMFNTKYKIRKEIEKVYIKYIKLIE